MRRADRLFDLIARLQGGDRHRAEDLARELGVSVRTIYRDMDTLRASGVPVTGTRGTGYRAETVNTIPPLTVTDAEVEALQLGLAIVSETTDPDLRAAALALADKIDGALPEHPPAPGVLPLAVYPFADAARGFSHMATIRAAIRGRQKLDVSSRGPDGRPTRQKVRPLQLDHWGRIWILTAWSEDAAGFVRLRLDLIDQAGTLPELFVDEPGKRLSDAAS